jgi:hypothetical protein
MERDDTAAIMAEIAKLSHEMRQLRLLVEAEVIRAICPYYRSFNAAASPLLDQLQKIQKTNKRQTQTRASKYFHTP